MLYLKIYDNYEQFEIGIGGVFFEFNSFEDAKRIIDLCVKKGKTIIIQSTEG